ncbi:MAG: hypothetical protein U0990_01840 [Candidatus Nanopelagicales bacterium]|nr:hypothetical protein [Candidatus Nanopelagicales bacterium]MDZ4248810.1 hypothetical protein [Candidatus Nanopelagicales bacterium]
MGEVDGRGMAIGIVAGVAVGLLVLAFTGNVVWLGLMAAIGAVLGINIRFGSRDDH